MKWDPGWRGPALLLRVDEKDGTAGIEYQAKPYLVFLRHTRPFQGIFMVELQREDVETSLHHLMRYVKSLADYLIGRLKKKNGMWHQVARDEYPIQKVREWGEMASKSMKKEPFHGIMMGKCLRTFKPPANTIGTMLSWIRSGRNYPPSWSTRTPPMPLPEKISVFCTFTPTRSLLLNQNNKTGFLLHINLCRHL